MKKIIVFLLICFFSTTAFGAPLQPIDKLKGPIESAIAVLKDPNYTGDDKKEAQREKIWEIVKDVFDFQTISMYALARNWRKFNDEQKQNFTKVFTELLKNTYLDKLQGEFHNEQIVFLDQDMVSSTKAQVKTKVLREKIEIPMHYSMKLIKGEWRIYDVKIEGVSLVKNYRTQFKSVLAKNSPDELIQRLKEKNEKHKNAREIKSEN